MLAYKVRNQTGPDELRGQMVPATLGGRVITGDRAAMASLMPSWQIVEVPDGPSVTVDDWVGHLMRWNAEAGKWMARAYVCDECRAALEASGKPEPEAHFVSQCNVCGKPAV